MTHKNCEEFVDGCEVRVVFLDIFKAFDKVFHLVLLYKLRQKGITNNLLEILTDFSKTETKSRTERPAVLIGCW